MSDFKLACDPSWLSWVANKFVKKPFLGSFRRLIKDPLIHTFNWVVGSEDYNFDLYSSCKVDLPNDQLVLPALITALADQLYQRHTQQLHLSFADNIINYHIFMRSCSDLVSEEASFELAILSLCKRKLCRLITSDGEKFLVITHPSSSSSSSSSSTMVGNEDKIYRLKMLEMRLEKEVEKLEEKINQCRQTAKQFTKEGKSKMALMVLKKKKSLQDLLQHKYNNVDKVSSLLLSIQQTEHNKQLIDAFSSGVEAFKGVRERSGLSDDKLDATMLEVQETLEQHEEINQLISKPMAVSDWTDEDIEAELNDLVANQEAEKQLSDLSSLLPDVPSHNVSIPVADKDKKEGARKRPSSVLFS